LLYRPLLSANFHDCAIRELLAISQTSFDTATFT
jgi:hypothetical protein